MCTNSAMKDMHKLQYLIVTKFSAGAEHKH